MNNTDTIEWKVTKLPAMKAPKRKPFAGYYAKGVMLRTGPSADGATDDNRLARLARRAA